MIISWWFQHWLYLLDLPTSWERLIPRCGSLVTGDGGNGLVKTASELVCLIFDFSSNSFWRSEKKDLIVQSFELPRTCLCSRPFTCAFQNVSLVNCWLQSAQHSCPAPVYLKMHPHRVPCVLIFPEDLLRKRWVNSLLFFLFHQLAKCRFAVCWVWGHLKTNRSNSISISFYSSETIWYFSRFFRGQWSKWIDKSHKIYGRKKTEEKSETHTHTDIRAMNKRE